MAAKSKKIETKSTEAYKYPSYHGSHKSMIVENHVVADDKFVVCKDDDGMYVTEKKNLDNRMADPYRFSTLEFRKKFFAEMGVTVVAPMVETANG